MSSSVPSKKVLDQLCDVSSKLKNTFILVLSINYIMVMSHSDITDAFPSQLESV